MSAHPHVLVVGGGLGGLALAQGLRKADVSVAVYERDRTRTDRLQGYRIHINPAGTRALHDVLPPNLYDAFLATTGLGSDKLKFATEQLTDLLEVDYSQDDSVEPIDRHHSVSRITLRQVFLAGMDDVVHFDKQFVRYENEPDGRVTAYFADGTSATGDVLVGADGARSRVRQQRLPDAELHDTGVLAIVGKTPLDDRTRALLPPSLWEGPLTVIPPRSCGMFIAAQRFGGGEVALPDGIGGADHAQDLHPGMLFDNTADYVMWAFVAPKSWYGDGVDPTTLRPAEQHALASRLVSGWAPGLRRLVAESAVDTLSVFPIRSSVPTEAWPTTNVTLLGDAVHSMTPMQGIGANTALRDAQLLARNLIDAAEGRRPMVEAIRDYEAQMIDYGFDAVRRSMKATKQFVGGAVGRVGFKGFLRVAAKFPSIKQKAFGGTGES